MDQRPGGIIRRPNKASARLANQCINLGALAQISGPILAASCPTTPSSPSRRPSSPLDDNPTSKVGSHYGSENGDRLERPCSHGHSDRRH